MIIHVDDAPLVLFTETESKSNLVTLDGTLHV